MNGASEVLRLFGIGDLDVLVTGGTKGIGEMIVRGFHAAGARVFVSARSRADCERLTAELGERAIAVPADVSTAEGCDAVVADLRGHTTRLDVLVNNAGASWGASLEDYPDSAWDKVLAVNLKAPFHLSVACLALLREAALPQRPARIINVGSVDGLRVPRWETYAYSSSKAALHQLTRHLGARLASEHITVNALAPGVVPTKMTRSVLEDEGADLLRATPLGRTGVADDMAGAAIFLASPAASWITGVILPVDGGYATLR